MVYGVSERMTLETMWLIAQILVAITTILGIAAVMGVSVYFWRERQKHYREFTMKRLQRRPVSRTEQRYTPEREDSAE